MNIVPFRAEHVYDLEDTVQSEQGPDWQLGVTWEPQGLLELEKKGMAYTALDEENFVVGCAGLFTIWPQRAHAWMMASSDWGRRVGLRPVARFMRQVLDAYPARRVEATVLADWRPGHRLVEHLGFVRETAMPMRAYDPEGRSMHLYARVRE